MNRDKKDKLVSFHSAIKSRCSDYMIELSLFAAVCAKNNHKNFCIPINDA